MDSPNNRAPDPDFPAQIKLSNYRWTTAAAVALVVVYFFTSVVIAAHRPFWFDEIVTVLFARLPAVATIWKAVGHVDPWGMPAPYYVLVHGFQSLPGPAEVTARLPSVLAVAAGLLITFDCTRRLTDGLHGLIALAMLTCSFLPYYGFEARSYGICFMLAALSLWLWTYARPGRPSSVAFGATFFFAFVMHPYSFLCLLPYALSDLSSRRWPLLSSKTVGGVLGVFLAAALLSIHILAAGSGPRPFSGPHPSLSALEGAFSEIYPGGFFLIALMMVWIALVGVPLTTTPIPRMLPAERIGWLFLLVPLAGFLAAELVTKAFVPRYFIGMLPGIAVALSCLLWRHFRAKRLVAAGIFLLLTIVGLSKQLNLVRHPDSIDPYGQQTKTKQVLGLEAALENDHKQFILFSGSLLYLEAEYYSKHPEKYRFLATDDPTNRIPVYFAEYYPLKTWSVDDLRKHARETALIFPEPKTLEALSKAGFAATVRSAEPIRVVYLE